MIAVIQKHILPAYYLLFIFIAIAALIITFIVVYRLRKQRLKESLIEEKYAELQLVNQKLIENARINEAYIGHFFNVIAGYILRLEKLKRGVERKVLVKRYEDILLSFSDINIKKERADLYSSFDETFLKLFPNFISEFNALFKEEDQVWPVKGDGLSTDLRIFALLRLGICDCESVAGILEYSVNTIYVYKMRIKAKALVGGDEFDAAILSIKAAPLNGQVFLRESA